MVIYHQQGRKCLRKISVNIKVKAITNFLNMLNLYLIKLTLNFIEKFEQFDYIVYPSRFTTINKNNWNCWL